MKDVQEREGAVRRIKAWWADVLAGQVDEPHPIHGTDVDVAFKGGVLRLSGQLESAEDKQSLLKEAREHVGKGVDEIDAKHLVVAKRNEKPGILEQTLIAAFANPDVAEYARSYLIERGHMEPEQVEILDSHHETEARKLLPAPFVSDVQKAFGAGQAVLILRVDETAAFKMRELLDEETRSIWTIAAPPVPPRARGR